MAQRPPPQQQTQQKTLWTSLRLLWLAVVAFATVIGLLASVFALWPRMTVSTSGPFDESSSYSESFTLTNTSFIPLRNFDFRIGFCNMETAKNDLAFIINNNCNNADHIPHVLVGDLNWHAPNLARDESFTITLADELTTPTDKYQTTRLHVIPGWKDIIELKRANAVVIATFQPWLIRCWSWISEWVCERKFRFVAEEQPNGKVIWRSESGQCSPARQWFLRAEPDLRSL